MIKVTFERIHSSKEFEDKEFLKEEVVILNGY